MATGSMLSPAHANGTAYNVLNMRPLSPAHVSGTAYNLVNMRSTISVNQPDSINLSGLDEGVTLLTVISRLSHRAILNVPHFRLVF